MKYNTIPQEQPVEKEENERPPTQKVVNGQVVRKKPTKTSRFLSLMIADDIPSVKEYILLDVIIPGCKDIISDVIKGSIDQLMYGGDRRYTNAKQSSNYTTYNMYRNNKYSNNTRAEQQPARNTNIFTEVYLQSRTDADNVISELNSIVEQYGEATVADYNQCVGIAGKYTDCNFGWSDLRYLSPTRRRQGWTIGLMKPSAL